MEWGQCVCVFGEQWCESRGPPGERSGYPNPDDSAVSARVVLAGRSGHVFGSLESWERMGRFV